MVDKSNLRILIVDDEPINSFLFKKILNKEVYFHIEEYSVGFLNFPYIEKEMHQN